MAAAGAQKRGGGAGLALLRELPKGGRGLTVGTFACMAVQALMPVGFAVASGITVAAIPDAVAGGFDSPAGRRLVLGVVAVSCLFALNQPLRPVEDSPPTRRRSLPPSRPSRCRPGSPPASGWRG